MFCSVYRVQYGPVRFLYSQQSHLVTTQPFLGTEDNMRHQHRCSFSLLALYLSPKPVKNREKTSFFFKQAFSALLCHSIHEQCMFRSLYSSCLGLQAASSFLFLSQLNRFGVPPLFHVGTLLVRSYSDWRIKILIGGFKNRSARFPTWNFKLAQVSDL